MPFLNSRGDIAAGIANGIVSLNGVEISKGGAVRFDGDDFLMFQNSAANVVLTDLSGGILASLNRGANEIAANAGTYALWLSGMGVTFASPYTTPTTKPGWGLKDVGRDGTLAICPDRNSGFGLNMIALQDPEGAGRRFMNLDVFAIDCSVLRFGCAVWRNERDEVMVVWNGSVIGPLPTVKKAFQPRLLETGGVIYTTYHTNENPPRFILQRVNSPEGFVIETGDTFNTDAVTLADGTIALVWATTEAEYPGQIVSARFDTNSHRLVRQGQDDRILPLVRLSGTVVTPPVTPPVVPPVTPPKEPTKPMKQLQEPTDFSWDKVIILRGPNYVKDYRETGYVTEVRFTNRNRENGFEVYFTTLTTWPKTYPTGTDIGGGEPVNYSLMLLVKIDGQYFGLFVNRDYHDQPGEHAGGPSLDFWVKDMFYDVPELRDADYRDGAPVGFALFHSAVYRMNDSTPKIAGMLAERTNAAWTHISHGQASQTFPVGPVVVVPPPTGEPGETPGSGPGETPGTPATLPAEVAKRLDNLEAFANFYAPQIEELNRKAIDYNTRIVNLSDRVARAEKAALTAGASAVALVTALTKKVTALEKRVKALEPAPAAKPKKAA